MFSKALLFGGMLTMVACSNDVLLLDNGGDQNQPTGDVAYMKVRIQSADKMSRATTSPGYEFGTAEENDVKNVRFFFFDADGAAMDLTAYLVGQNDANVGTTDGPDKPNGNVEKVFDENLLVLENLKSNAYPSYMITILNNDEFRCGTNLTNTLELLDNYQKLYGSTNYFVMSTSSFSQTDNTYYHTNKLVPANFKNTPAAAVADGAPVEVYVERLASKVQVKIADDFTTETKTVNGQTLYALTQSIADGSGDNTEVDEDKLTTKLYLKVLGWALNTTANQSYMSKNIDTAWDFTWENVSWNIPGDHRSYWAKSWTYGDDAEAIESKVSFASTKALTNAINGVAYCNENTNEAENVYSQQKDENQAVTRNLVDSRVATNVVLKTQIVDENGNPIDMVMANGVLFKKADYLQYIVNRAYVSTGTGNGQLSAINIWVLENNETEGDETTGTTTKKEYKQLDKSYFNLAFPTTGYEGLGDVDVVLDETKFAGNTYYKYNAESTAADKYEVMTEAEVAAAIATIKEKLAAVQPTGANHAVIYDNGYNIYYIPVEHLAAKDAQTDVVEGYYGVVRNHWYKLSISSFSKVGHGMWDPSKDDVTEETKPEKPEDPLYYLGAHINILSWKVVDQNVPL